MANHRTRALVAAVAVVVMVVLLLLLLVAAALVVAVVTLVVVLLRLVLLVMVTGVLCLLVRHQPLVSVLVVWVHLWAAPQKPTPGNKVTSLCRRRPVRPWPHLWMPVPHPNPAAGQSSWSRPSARGGV